MFTFLATFPKVLLLREFTALRSKHLIERPVAVRQFVSLRAMLSAWLLGHHFGFGEGNTSNCDLDSR